MLNFCLYFWDFAFFWNLFYSKEDKMNFYGNDDWLICYFVCVVKVTE